MTSLPLSPSPGLIRAMDLYRSGRIWLTVLEASDILSCDPSSLTAAARQRNTLGTLEYFWAGSFLKISTMSVIRFLAGDYPLQYIFGTGIPEKGDQE